MSKKSKNTVQKSLTKVAQTRVPGTRDVNAVISVIASPKTQQIRRELIDLARHFLGTHGIGANHDTGKEGPHRAIWLSRTRWKGGPSFTHEDV